MRRRQFIGLKRRQAMAGYVFLAPIIIGLVWLFLPALLQAWQYSVSDIRMTAEGIELTPIGLEHYRDILFVNRSAPYLLDSLRTMAVQVPVIIIFSFFLSNVLNQQFFGRNTARAVFFLPVIMAAGVLTQLESGNRINELYTEGARLDTGMAAGAVYNYQNLKALLAESELNRTLVSVVLYAIDSLYSVVTSSGVQVLIFLAGLQSISPSLYEAAKVEGANGWICFWKISFPMISPLIMVNVVYTMMDSFTRYDNAAMAYIRVFLYGNSRYSYATALSILYIGVVAVVLGITYLLIDRMMVYRDRAS